MVGPLGDRQACILYGGAEFSRDLDLSIGVDADNLAVVHKALVYLEAELIFFPRFEVEALNRGHACHFRCHAEGVEGLRIDLMTKMRGCPAFEDLWDRRSIVNLPDIGDVGLLSLPDLVQAKKTQREKDWPMIRRLIETDVVNYDNKADEERVRFWLKECRTPYILTLLAQKHTKLCHHLIADRLLLRAALDQDHKQLELQLFEEERIEKETDREYWRPLRDELENWRRQRRSQF